MRLTRAQRAARTKRNRILLILVWPLVLVAVFPLLVSQSLTVGQLIGLYVMLVLVTGFRYFAFEWAAAYRARREKRGD